MICSWFRLGFRCLSPFFSLLWFRCLSPFSYLLSILRKGVLFHQDFLVPPGSGWGPGACLPSSLSLLFSGKGFCFIMDFLVPLRFGGFRCLSPFFSLFPNRRFWRRFREALVQSQVKFNRVPEKVLEKVSEALVQSQVKFNRVLKKVLWVL